MKTLVECLQQIVIEGNSSRYYVDLSLICLYEKRQGLNPERYCIVLGTNTKRCSLDVQRTKIFVCAIFQANESCPVDEIEQEVKGHIYPKKLG